MTGHQDHPGTGRTLMGETTKAVSIQEIGKACGVERVVTLSPYDVENTQKVIDEELNANEPSLIVSYAPCPLRERKRVGVIRRVDKLICKNCKMCIKLGCPAIDGTGEMPSINELLCSGCGLCEQICPFDAISQIEEEQL
jgi:indolepyruvate ferredoxin oxidoreductase alpha subunit